MWSERKGEQISEGLVDIAKTRALILGNMGSHVWGWGSESRNHSGGWRARCRGGRFFCSLILEPFSQVQRDMVVEASLHSDCVIPETQTGSEFLNPQP